tara:strand:- start:340 stop:579 length:240 start_codon:yes stop_codon:yes gene_type:complete
MENKSSKHGYQKNIIIKYGEIDTLFDEKLINKIPIRVDNKYAPESPIYNAPTILNIKRTNKIKVKFLKNSKSCKRNVFR